MLPYAVTIFLSAFLLFEVQLFLAKYILPWFGGVPSVWTTCMLFFQVLLLGGYGYAHWLSGKRSAAFQRTVHFSLLAASVAVLLGLAAAWGTPLLPGNDWKPAADDAPVLKILILLTVSVGLPFFVLSATNPLLQAWFSRSMPGVSPYRLYSLSNLGSLLGLVSYPFLVEVLVPLRPQSWLWSAGYLAFAAGIVAAGWRLHDGIKSGDRVRRPRREEAAPATAEVALWFALAACASVLLLATTNQMTQEIAVVPFLWMVPLTLYLLSFILCFDSDRWYSRRLYLPSLVVMFALVTLLLEHGLKTHIFGQILIYSLTLFAACMVAHGELARLKPHPRHLTSYYLAISFGGALGGVFVGILAPYWFLGFWELPIGLVACTALVLTVLWRDRHFFQQRAAGHWPVLGPLVISLGLAGFVFSDKFSEADSLATLFAQFPGGSLAMFAGAAGVMLFSAGALGWLCPRQTPAGGSAARRWLGVVCTRKSGPARLRLGAALTALLVFAATHLAIATSPMEGTVKLTRNFYGLLAVMSDDADNPAEHALKLRHGRITHGLQYQARERRLEPNTYYGPNSGIAYAFREHPRRLRGEKLHVGVIGLGTGTLAAYGRPGDDFRFYEINPDVVRLAHGEGATFTYLNDTPAAVSVALGDARLTLERETPAGFDILAIDAFSSDSIPVHLLTREALDIYLGHLAGDGVLAIHISNRYVDLNPVVWKLAQVFDLHLTLIESDGKEAPGEYSSSWVLLSRAGWVATAPALVAASETIPAPARAPLWTDDYSNVFQVVRMGSARDAFEAVGGCLLLDCPESSATPPATNK